MAEPHSASSPGNLWRTAQSRITTFHANESIMDDWSEWWRQTFDQEPARTETRPHEQIHSVTGPVDHGIMIVTARPGRTDFLLQPNNELGTDIAPSHASISFWQIASSVTTPTRAWIQSQKQLYRLALGAVLLSPGPDLETAYLKLSALLPKVDLTGITEPDFTYRVNRPRDSVARPGIPINRVTTWGIAQGQNVAFTPGVQSPQTSPIQYAAHLELDINTRTSPDQVFDPATSSALLDELLQLGHEIATTGDQP